MEAFFVLQDRSFRKCGENRVLPTRPTFLATKPQVTRVQKSSVLEGSEFSPHFRNPSPRKASARPFTQHVSSKKGPQPVRLPPFRLISSPKQVGYFLIPRHRRFATDATASSLTESQAGEGLCADDVGRTAIDQVEYLGREQPDLAHVITYRKHRAGLVGHGANT